MSCDVSDFPKRDSKDQSQNIPPNFETAETRAIDAPGIFGLGRYQFQSSTCAQVVTSTQDVPAGGNLSLPPSQLSDG